MTDTLVPDIHFENHPDPMWVLDPASLRFLAVNDAAVTEFGYSRREFLGLTLANLRLPDDGPATGTTDAAMPAAGEAGIWRLQRKSGGIVDAHIRWHGIDFDGQPAVAASMRDVTGMFTSERQSAARNAREQEARLRTAQRLLGIGIWKLFPETGDLTWSDNVHEMYGVAPEAFGRTFDAYVALVHPDDRAAMIAAYEAFASTPDEYFHFRHRIVRPDGRVVHVRGVGETARTDEGVVLTGVVQDISDQLQAEEELARAGHIVRIAGQAARLGGWRVDLNPERLTWSAETSAIHELPEGQSPTVDRALEYYAPEYRDHIRAVFGECVAHGKPFDEVLEIVTAKGNRLWVRAIGEAERNADGDIVAVQGAFQDITELVEARNRSERLARRLVETLANISDAFFTLDTSWRFTFVNSQAERVLGRSSEELLGTVVWDAFPAAVGSTFQREYEAAVATRRTARFTERYAPLGAWFEVNAYPTTDGLAVYFRDVTQERARDEHLHLLEAAVSRQNDILLITDASSIDAPDGPRIVYVNDAFVRRTGYSREDAIGRTPRLLQGPATQRAELDRIREALTAGRSVRSELLNYTKSGEVFWLELDIVPIVDRDGRHTHWVAIQRDITGRKRAEESVRFSEERFRLVAQATNDVIWDWDLVENGVWWNDSLKTLFGHDPEAIEAGPNAWTERIHPADKARVTESILAVIRGRETNWRDEYRFFRADGTAATVVDRGFVIRDERGQAIRMLGSMADVTGQRELEERLRQSQKMEAVGQLTGGVAHDFNNLLTVILGNAELLTEALSDRQQLRGWAEMTMNAAERGADLTNRLLAFARRQALDPKLVRLDRLVADMAGLLRRTLTENIDLRFVSAEDVWACAVDPGQLEVALLNLTLNARDSMPEGGRLTIEISNAILDGSYSRRHEDVEAGEYVVVVVSDTGTGMPPEIVARAFEPFFTTKEVGKGSGLGLSMVYGFVKQSGGHAKIYSEVGQGTAVRLYFPRAPSTEGAAPLPEVDTNVIGGGERILVVEDDVFVREHVVAQLEALGYRVTGAGDGPQALETLRRGQPFDLLFTDVIMPGGMNGRQLAEAAKLLRPDLKVLFTSGYTENAIVHQGRLDPGVDLLGKPYRRQELAAKVRKVLDGAGNA